MSYSIVLGVTGSIAAYKAVEVVSSLMKQGNNDTNHVSLAEHADIIVVAPATANFIGKVVSGIADDALTCTVMAARFPVIIAPAMNDSMYLNPIVQENIKKLKKLGYVIIEPEEGRLCTGRIGIGRLASVEKIVGVINEELNKKKDK